MFESLKWPSNNRPATWLAEGHMISNKLFITHLAVIYVWNLISALVWLNNALDCIKECTHFVVHYAISSIIASYECNKLNAIKYSKVCCKYYLKAWFTSLLLLDIPLYACWEGVATVPCCVDTSVPCCGNCFACCSVPFQGIHCLLPENRQLVEDLKRRNIHPLVFCIVPNSAKTIVWVLSSFCVWIVVATIIMIQSKSVVILTNGI